jgi:hypothetical protein
MTNAAKEWIDVGGFDSVISASKQIRELEEYSSRNLFFRMLVETESGSRHDLYKIVR